MKREHLAQEEYYHICGRGNKKQVLFRDRRDYLRFLFNILYFQANLRFYNISRYVDNHEDSHDFGVTDGDVKEICNEGKVGLAAFCLMPNHYHLIVKNLTDGGVSSYMQRVLTAFSNYFNTKYDTSGHVFEGAYNLIHVSSDQQLQYLFSYVHKNPKELAEWRENYWDYPWSSCKDFKDGNRWGSLLQNDVITKQFTDFADYKNFLEESSAKGSFDLPEF